MAAPAWYAEGLGAPFVSHEQLIGEALPGWLAALCLRFGVLRGTALALLSRGAGLALIKGLPGTATALVVTALTARGRRVVVLEFIRRPPASAAWRRAPYELWRWAVEAPAIRRSMAVGQVLTDWERRQYARSYGIEEGRFSYVRWPLCRWGTTTLRPVSARGSVVLSSGRAYSDWGTLFEAARGADWSLTVACGSADLPRVRRLNLEGTVRVYSELSRAEHDALLRDSDVYVMAMREAGASAGHVRLMAAVENGVPVLASEIRALTGYVRPGETVELVEPGDSAALRASIDALLADPGKRSSLRDGALERAREWTYEDYFAALRAVILAALEKP